MDLKKKEYSLNFEKTLKLFSNKDYTLAKLIAYMDS